MSKIELSFLFGKLMCLFRPHRWHELYDPLDLYKNKYMCLRCLKFIDYLPEELQVQENPE